MTRFDTRTLRAKLARKGLTASEPELLAGGHLRLTVSDGKASAPLIVPATSAAPRTADNAVAWAKRAIRASYTPPAGLGTTPPAEPEAVEPDSRRALHGRSEPRQRPTPPRWLLDKAQARGVALRPAAAAPAARPEIEPELPDPEAPVMPAGAFVRAVFRQAGLTRLADNPKLDEGQALHGVVSAWASVGNWIAQKGGLMHLHEFGGAVSTTRGHGLITLTTAGTPDQPTKAIQIFGLAAPVRRLLPDAPYPDYPDGVTVAMLTPGGLVAVIPLTAAERRGAVATHLRTALTMAAQLHVIAKHSTGGVQL